MKQIKIICVVMIFIIAGILIWKLTLLNTNEDHQIISNDPIEIEESKYAIELEKEKYNLRLLESENKEYATLFIETNIFEGEEEITIKYNNRKYLLNTANPLLENVNIQKGEDENSFVISVSSLENYSIIFIKKDIQNTVGNNDIIVN